MKSLELGDIVKVVSHAEGSEYAKNTLSIGEICKVVDIGEDNKRFRINVSCDVKSLRFCRRSDTKKCIHVESIITGKSIWICDVEVEKVKEVHSL